MRADTTSLLQRLGQKDFRYREFHDAFADMELWPIFEALLADERVVGRPMSALAEKEAAMRASEAKHYSPAARPADSPDMFSRYAEPGPAAASRPGDDLRGFLGQLSSKNSG